MAIRIHVVAAHDASPEQFMECASALGLDEVYSANGWQWMQLSVWGTTGSAIHDALKTVDGTRMHVMSEDGCRWYLHLRKEGLDPYSTFHQFTWLEHQRGRDDSDDLLDDEDLDVGVVRVIEIGRPEAPATSLEPLAIDDPYFAPYAGALENDLDVDDEVEYSAARELIEDYASLGAPLGEEIVQALEGASDDAVVETFTRLHAAEIAEQLRAFGLIDNPSRMEAVLNGSVMTEGEHESDLGNLPRFLAELGLGKFWEDAVRELAREGEDDEAYEESAEVMALVRDIAPVAIEGGPVAVGMDDAPLLIRAVSYLHEWPMAAFEAHLPAGGRALFSEAPSYVTLHQEDRVVRLGITSSAPLEKRKSAAKIAGLLKALPDETSLELAACRAEGGGGQRYVGRVRGGEWLIDSSFPAMDAATLQDALRVFRSALHREALMLRDAAEGDALMRHARENIALRDMLPEAEDGRIVPQRGTHERVARLLFLLRYGTTWDAAQALADDQARFDDWTDFEAELEAEAALPTTGVVLYEGEGSRFLEADVDAASIDEAMRAELAKAGEVDAEFAALGFAHVGDVVCERVGQAIVRCYANASENAYGCHYVMPFGMVWKDIVAPMSRDVVLTTSNGLTEPSLPQLRLLQHRCRARELATLLAEHRAGVAILESLEYRGAPIDASLLGIVRAMDAYIVRRMGPSEENES